jgi:hypothetical protein
MRRLLFAAFCLVAPLLLACGGADEPTGGGSGVPDVSETGAGVAGSFVGKVEGTDAFIGLVVLGSRETLAYVCDSKGISQWFRGIADRNRVSLRADPAVLEGALSLAEAKGTVTLRDGVPRSFAAEPAVGFAGLYRASDSGDGLNHVGGWIVLAHGEQRGGIGSDGSEPLGATPTAGQQIAAVTPSATVSFAAFQTLVAEDKSKIEALKAQIRGVELQIAALQRSAENVQRIADAVASAQTAGKPTATAVPVTVIPIGTARLQPTRLSSTGAAESLK